MSQPLSSQPHEMQQLPTMTINDWPWGPTTRIDGWWWGLTNVHRAHHHDQQGPKQPQAPMTINKQPIALLMIPQPAFILHPHSPPCRPCLTYPISADTRGNTNPNADTSPNAEVNQTQTPAWTQVCPLVFESPDQSGFLMPKGFNRNRNWSAFSPEVKRPNWTAKRLQTTVFCGL